MAVTKTIHEGNRYNWTSYRLETKRRPAKDQNPYKCTAQDIRDLAYLMTFRYHRERMKNIKTRSKQLSIL